MEKMLSCDEFGCLYIAVPNSLHYAHALRALEHGKHVILEKPFCTTLDEAESLFRTAEERGCFLLEAISILPRPVFAQVREWLPLIGDVKLDTGISPLNVILGSVLGVAIAFVLKFFKFSEFDYSFVGIVHEFAGVAEHGSA